MKKLILTMAVCLLFNSCAIADTAKKQEQTKRSEITRLAAPDDPMTLNEAILSRKVIDEKIAHLRTEHQLMQRQHKELTEYINRLREEARIEQEENKTAE